MWLTLCNSEENGDDSVLVILTKSPYPLIQRCLTSEACRRQFATSQKARDSWEQCFSGLHVSELAFDKIIMIAARQHEPTLVPRDSIQ